MIDVEVQIAIDDENPQTSPWLDETELKMMIDQTRAQIGEHVRAKLSKLSLTEPLKVIVTGAYSLDTEQMELSYHIDTDDKQLLLKAVTALNR
ncbi:MAG: hypothetical protein RLP44_24775 [Aggregatilineales bacterium]